MRPSPFWGMASRKIPSFSVSVPTTPPPRSTRSERGAASLGSSAAEAAETVNRAASTVSTQTFIPSTALHSPERGRQPEAPLELESPRRAEDRGFLERPAHELERQRQAAVVQARGDRHGGEAGERGRGG